MIDLEVEFESGLSGSYSKPTILEVAAWSCGLEVFGTRCGGNWRSWRPFGLGWPRGFAEVVDR